MIEYLSLTLCAVETGPSWGALAFSIISAAVGSVVAVACVDAVGSPLNGRTGYRHIWHTNFSHINYIAYSHLRIIRINVLTNTLEGHNIMKHHNHHLIDHFIKWTHAGSSRCRSTLDNTDRSHRWGYRCRCWCSCSSKHSSSQIDHLDTLNTGQVLIMDILTFSGSPPYILKYYLGNEWIVFGIYSHHWQISNINNKTIKMYSKWSLAVCKKWLMRCHQLVCDHHFEAMSWPSFFCIQGWHDGVQSVLQLTAGEQILQATKT